MAEDYIDLYGKTYNEFAKKNSFYNAPTYGTLNPKAKNAVQKGFSSERLLQIAEENGLGDKAREILATKGENVNEIFSGGPLMDILDGLNILDYGIVGMLKGKSFAEGVKTRQSFADKDSLGKHGLIGTIAGIAADIAVTWPIWMVASPFKILSALGVTGKVQKGARSVFGLTKTGKTTQGVTKILAKAPKNNVERMGQWATRKLVGALGADPVFNKAHKLNVIGKAQLDDSVLAMAKVMDNASDEVVSKFPDLFKRMPDGTLGRVGREELPRLFDGDTLKQIESVYDMMDGIQRQAVDLNLLRTFDEDYVANIYVDEATKRAGRLQEYGIGSARLKGRKLKYSTPEEVQKAVDRAADSFRAKNKGLSQEKLVSGLRKQEEAMRLGFEKKKKLIQEIRAKKGEYTKDLKPFLKGIVQSGRDVENAKFFREINKTHGLTDALAKELDIDLAGYVKLPGRTKAGLNKYGDLAGKYVPKHVADEIAVILKSKTPAEEVASMLWGFFKWGHTAGHPAGHVRNIMGNNILNFWKLGMTPGDPRSIKAMGIAAKEMVSPGQFTKELRAINSGFGLNNFASAELGHIWDIGDRAIKKGIPANIKKAGKWIMDKSSALYGGAESHAKLSAYVYGRTTKKMGMDEAWRLAEAATFDYNAVSPLIRSVRESVWGVPFLTFGIKAAPLVAETALKAPQRITAIAKIRSGIEKMCDLKETTRERANEPSWIKDGLYVKLPMKDKKGRSAYFDLTYIIPFGDMVTGQFFSRQMNAETGLPESIAESMLKKSPLLNIITEIGKNQDFYGNKIWKESDSMDKRTVDISRHLMKAYLPPLVAEQLPGGYIREGKRKGQRRPSIIKRALSADADNQYRTGMQEFLRHTGMKIQPINADLTETYMEFEKKRALETLLGESGLLRSYERSYIPKK